MKLLYFECNMGAAGDMLMASLLDILDNKEDFIKRFNSLNIPKVKTEYKKSEKCGITGTQVEVLIDGEIEKNCHHHHHHHHTGMNDIKHIVSHLDICDKVKTDIINVYNIIADAESKVHNKKVDEIHFHEVGNMDAIADITGVCMLINEIGADKIMVSPINTGKGSVKCAHGILPVPAPATALILESVPSYNNDISGELCTPTGAALLKYFADEFGNMPVMTNKKIGYGMGKKDFEEANCVRAFLGDTNEKNEFVYELKFNIDDMTGEEIAFGCDILRENGALEVFQTPVYMKKNRLGTLITVITNSHIKEEIIKLIFKHFSTIGIRENKCNRYILNRETVNITTEFGNIRKKCSKGYGVEKQKFEYEDIKKIAKDNNKSILEIKDIINKNE
ncbi:MAG: nickel pincer cofactor biosynthesis protein LarC [Lachnospirales bacterium]